MPINWIPISNEYPLPPEGMPILLTGQSDGRPPHNLFIITGHNRFIITGKYEPHYQPINPWRDCEGTALSDNGWIPTHWAPLTDDMFPHS